MTKQNNKSNNHYKKPAIVTAPTTERILLDDIQIKTEWQFRDVDEAIVSRYAADYQNGAQFPPITVAKLDGETILVDGWHRIMALYQLDRVPCHPNLSSVEAIVKQATSAAEVRCWAFEANTKHGKGLSNKEIRKGFRLWIKAKRHRRIDGSLKSYREIAAEMGGGKYDTTIRAWMRTDFKRIYDKMADNSPRWRIVDKDDDRDFEIEPEDEERMRAEKMTAEAIDKLESVLQALPAASGNDNLDRLGHLIDRLQQEWERLAWMPRGRSSMDF